MLSVDHHKYLVSRGIEVWINEMRNPPTLLRTRTCEDRLWTILKVDERFIVAVSHLRELNPEKAVTLFFISTETLGLFTSLSAMNYEGYLCERTHNSFSQSKKINEIQMPLRSGSVLLIPWQWDRSKFVNCQLLRITFRSRNTKFIKLLDTWTCSNSNVMVIGWKYVKHLYI
jgi:hypothetical protein